MISLKKVILVFLLVTFNLSVYSQCAMCKAVLESDLDAGGEVAKGVNNGILYLMFIPFLLVGTVGYFIYKNNINNKT